MAEAKKTAPDLPVPRVTGFAEIEDGTMRTQAFRALEHVEEQIILAEMQGLMNNEALGDALVYSFEQELKDHKGDKVIDPETNLPVMVTRVGPTIIGIVELARQIEKERGVGFVERSPEITSFKSDRGDTIYRVIVGMQDPLTGATRYEIEEVKSYVPFAVKVAQHKARRNALRNFIPYPALVAMARQWYADGKTVSIYVDERSSARKVGVRDGKIVLQDDPDAPAPAESAATDQGGWDPDAIASDADKRRFDGLMKKVATQFEIKWQDLATHVKKATKSGTLKNITNGEIASLAEYLQACLDQDTAPKMKVPETTPEPAPAAAPPAAEPSLPMGEDETSGTGLVCAFDEGCDRDISEDELALFATAKAKKAVPDDQKPLCEEHLMVVSGKK